MHHQLSLPQSIESGMDKKLVLNIIRLKVFTDIGRITAHKELSSPRLHTVIYNGIRPPLINMVTNTIINKGFCNMMFFLEKKYAAIIVTTILMATPIMKIKKVFEKLFTIACVLKTSLYAPNVNPVGRSEQSGMSHQFRWN